MSSDQHRDRAASVFVEEASSALPDVAAAPGASAALDWVGMDAIDLPLRIADTAGDLRVPARVAVAVDLAAGASRGIHMSRLYTALDAAVAERPLTPGVLEALLREFLASHAGLSTRARVRIGFDHFLRRPALASGHSGWRRYPVRLSATLLRERYALDVDFEVVYSSTCPASTALARQLVAADFARAFPPDAPLSRDAALRWLEGEQGMRATPHSQRSTAAIGVRLAPGIDHLPLARLIDAAEAVLATPVQAAVKRIDEQAFARANGENPMFCEDAARRLQSWLTTEPLVRGFHVRVAHHESLHAHDAVAEAGSEAR
ncbi:MAG: GTP cyclohydrolase I FolE2 [Proteobacteria bacterium]|nr:GTP cyclohydrolase I FolE2 [Pseudomonadota bacterium]